MATTVGVGDVMAMTPAISYVTSERTRKFIHPLLTAVMTGAQFMGLVLIFQQIFPEEPWVMVNLLTYTFALEGIYTTIWLNHRDRLSLNRAAYRGAELVLLLVVVRFFSWMVLGSFPEAEAFRSYLLDPWLIIDHTFLWSAVITLLAWQRGLLLGKLFHHLAIRDYEAVYYTLSTTEKAEQMMHYSHSPARNRAILVDVFFQNWVGGGIFLAFCAALTTFDVPEFATMANPFDIDRFGLQPELLTAMILYFVIGFWLLSQMRLTLMQARWMTSGVQQHNDVSQQWRGSSLRLLLIVAGIAAFLPIGSTVPISRILNAILGGIIFIVQLIMVLFGVLIAFIFSLIGRDSPVETEAETGQTIFEVLPETAPPLEVVPPNETTALLFGSLFWVVVGVSIVIALIFFMRDRGYGTAQEKTLRQWWHGFLEWLRSFGQEMSEQVEALQLAIRQRLAAESDEGDGRKRPFHFIRVNGLSPREQIRYFYLSTVRRAGERGVARRDSATPKEYAEVLTEELPQAEEEVDALTDAFLKARYSPREIDKGEADGVKAQWKRLRRNLRSVDGKDVNAEQ